MSEIFQALRSYSVSKRMYPVVLFPEEFDAFNVTFDLFVSPNNKSQTDEEDQTRL